MEQRTVTEKRFGEYHEDDRSVTLRSCSATCGGVQRYSLSALPRQGWGLMCHRLQVGTTRTSDARKVDRMCKEVMCLEVFHCALEIGGVAQPLKARDYKDPLVVVYELSESGRTFDDE